MNPRLIKGAVPVIHRLLVNPAPSYRPIISIRHYSKEWTKHEDEIHKIWPFESADIPTYTPQKFYSSKSILTTVVNYLVRLCTINFYWTMFSDEYMKSVDAKMVPLVLKRTAEAISDGSDEAIDSVMTEALAKDTKNSLADLRMQGLSVDVDVLDVESVKLVKKFIHMGKEEAFDSTTPYHIRRQHFDLLWTPAGEIASTSGNKANSNDEPKPSKSIFSASPGGLRLFMMFNATADIRVNIKHDSRVIDTERRTLVVPLCIASPTYSFIDEMYFAFHSDPAENQSKPFRWSVYDLFMRVETNSMNQRRRYYTERIKHND